MASKKFLTLDIGVNKAKLAEFTVGRGSVPTLTRYATRDFDPLGPDVAVRTMNSMSDLVRELAAEMGVKGGSVSVLLPSTAVFPRPVKIDRAQKDKIDAMVRDEADQNLPFPIDEVVWDYQVVGQTAEGDFDTLIVATKMDNADDAAACAENAGFRLDAVEATPLALYNCAKFNYPDIDAQCSMILDIGARATTLVILDGGKIFVRGINVGGNVITNEIARGLAIEPAEAETIKKEIGFVALGGTYAADDETADKVSKIIRNVVTRLHSEVARSINFYRVQQGGAAPERLLITGGTSLAQNIGSFFQEKLQIDVEYLNPFLKVGLAPGFTDQAELLLLAPCVGMAVRAAGAASVKIDLTPPAVLDAQRFARRLPFFGLAVVSVLLAMGCWVMVANKNKEVYDKQKEDVARQLGGVDGDSRALTTAIADKDAVEIKTKWLEAALRSRSGHLQLWNLIGSAMLPDTWISTFKFSDEADGRYLALTVLGYKRELDKELRGRAEGSVGEYLLKRIKAADADELFLDHDTTVTKVQREPVIGDSKGIEIQQIILRLKMREKLGEINKDGKLPTEWVAK